jgi:hypothetical protein
LPVAFVVRGILERRTLAEGASFVRTVPHASGQAYHVGSPEGFESFECSAAGAAAWNRDAERAVHTNHPLATVDVDDTGERRPDTTRSEERLAFLERELEGVQRPEDAERILTDRTAPICFVGSADDPELVTIAAISMELSVPPLVRIAPGPPANGAAFEPVPFRG